MKDFSDGAGFDWKGIGIGDRVEDADGMLRAVVEGMMRAGAGGRLKAVVEGMLRAEADGMLRSEVEGMSRAAVEDTLRTEVDTIVADGRGFLFSDLLQMAVVVEE